MIKFEEQVSLKKQDNPHSEANGVFLGERLGRDPFSCTDAGKQNHSHLRGKLQPGFSVQT